MFSISRLTHMTSPHFRIFTYVFDLLPVFQDTVKTTMQVEANGLQMLRKKIKVGGVRVLYSGALAASGATFVGYVAENMCRFSISHHQYCFFCFPPADFKLYICMQTLPMVCNVQFSAGKDTQARSRGSAGVLGQAGAQRQHWLLRITDF